MKFKLNATDLDFIINIISDFSFVDKLTDAKTYGEYLA